jgi:uncharacterized protein (TIGR02391 family)
MASNRSPIITEATLESLCQFIADSGSGLTGTEIAKLLADCSIPDTDPGLSKAKRLYNAFVHSQNRHQCSNQVLNFMAAAMKPARYFGKEEVFQYRRNELNKRLALIGLELTEKAQYRKVEPAQTLSEAQQRASHFKYKLEVRSVHQEIFKYCNDELVQENYFHAVFEAVKSVTDRMRAMTGLHADGNLLAETAFSTSAPMIRINLLQDDTQRSEHLGLCNLIKGLFGLIRNPTAHRPKIAFIISEAEALEIMTVVSLVHNKLDRTI